MVDDNKTAHKIIAEQMLSRNMEVDTISSAREAIAKLRSAALAEKPYQMAILDYMMPEMDGEELAKTIKEDKKIKI